MIYQLQNDLQFYKILTNFVDNLITKINYAYRFSIFFNNKKAKTEKMYSNFQHS